jgi:hypothetical protein
VTYDCTLAQIAPHVFAESPDNHLVEELMQKFLAEGAAGLAEANRRPSKTGARSVDAGLVREFSHAAHTNWSVVEVLDAVL